MASSDSDLDNALSIVSTVATCCAVLAAAAAQNKKSRGGPRPGKRPNRNILRGHGARQLDRDYFCRNSNDTPLFSDSEFERRFGVTRQVYETVRAAVCNFDSYFEQRTDATGLLGASTDQKLAAGFRQLSMGITADA